MNLLLVTSSITQSLAYSLRFKPLEGNAADVRKSNTAKPLNAQLAQVLNCHIEPIWLTKGRLLYQLSLKLHATPTQGSTRANQVSSVRPRENADCKSALALMPLLPQLTNRAV